MKSKLLVLELWGLGDLAIATPFLCASSEQFEVFLLAKPYALDLQKRLWPAVTVIPFKAPWTVFRGKYRLQKWPWLELFKLLRRLRSEKFNYAVSARWDPRENLFLRCTGAKHRIGFPRLRSELLLTRTVHRLAPLAHRYDDWWVVSQELGFPLPRRRELPAPPPHQGAFILLHSGAAQPVRVWPLDRCQRLAQRLRDAGWPVQIACDPGQLEWWMSQGERQVVVPHDIASLFDLFTKASTFIGNDSGPGHLAAIAGVPTFTIFGPQWPEWFLPLHPEAEWIDGNLVPLSNVLIIAASFAPLSLERYRGRSLAEGSYFCSKTSSCAL